MSRAALAALPLFFLLSACGYKGPLYLPPPKPATPASAQMPPATSRPPTPSQAPPASPVLGQ